MYVTWCKGSYDGAVNRIFKATAMHFQVRLKTEPFWTVKSFCIMEFIE
jgi:hypothetical protein